MGKIELSYDVSYGIFTLRVSDLGLSKTKFNGTSTSDQLKNLVDPTVLILLTVLVPILAVIGIVMFFLPRD